MTHEAQSGAETGSGTLLILPRMHGFFSLFFQALGQAHLAQKTGVTPIIYFNRQCLYWSDEGYNSERNVWTYFFEPVSSLDIEGLFPGVPLSALEGYSLQQFEGLCTGSRIVPNAEYPEDLIEYKSPLGVWSQRRFVYDLIARYAVLRPLIREQVEAYQRENFASHKIIGVHYRGLEKSQGQTQDGVVPGRAFSMQHFYLREIRSRLRRFPSAKIFVATDSAEFLENARKQFGEAVLSREATRLNKEDEILGLHFKPHAQQTRPLLAEEVLLDALLLSRTNILIHGVSGVANAALCFNPNLPHFDVEVRYGKTAFYLKKEVIRQFGRFAPATIAKLRRAASRKS